MPQSGHMWYLVVSPLHSILLKVPAGGPVSTLGGLMATPCLYQSSVLVGRASNNLHLYGLFLYIYYITRPLRQCFGISSSALLELISIHCFYHFNWLAIYTNFSLHIHLYETPVNRGFTVLEYYFFNKNIFFIIKMSSQINSVHIEYNMLLHLKKCICTCILGFGCEQPIISF